MSGFISDYWHLCLVLFFLLGLAIQFYWQFLKVSVQLKAEIQWAIQKLKTMPIAKDDGLVDLDIIRDQVMSSITLAHLWSEYSKTLHPQLGGENEYGQRKIKCWRSTALAETFFTDQSIVDSRLKADYFKHLPGVLTGIGIIGTFAGLINGLQNFKVSGDGNNAQTQLELLLNSVGHAFYVSAFAIFLAMLITWLEKTILTSRYADVEKLREHIDGFFRSGAGEEYLQQLARSSEVAATQTKQLRDSLVIDLREILTNLVDRQIAAQAENAVKISADIGKVVADTISKPLEVMTVAVQRMTGNQEEAVNKLLTDVLANFSSQMQEMFGGQMRGMADLLQQSSEAMQETARQFGQLASNINTAGTNTVDSMGEKLSKALDNMDTRQSAMNARMGEFVEQIRQLISQTQTETNQKLQDAMVSIGSQVSTVVETLRKQVDDADLLQSDRNKRLEESTRSAVASLSGQVELLLAQSIETNKSLQQSVAALAGATDKAISGLNSGAEILYIAASDFAKAGSGVSATMNAAAVAAETIKVAAHQLAVATDGAKIIITDYGRTRDVFVAMVAELKNTVANAKAEAAMTSKIITQINSAAKELSVAQQQSEEYLKGVTSVLIKAHESFRDNIDKTLGEGNRKFQAELTTSVNLLSGAIKNIADVIEDIPQPSRR